MDRGGERGRGGAGETRGGASTKVEVRGREGVEVEQKCGGCVEGGGEAWKKM